MLLKSLYMNLGALRGALINYIFEVPNDIIIKSAFEVHD